MSLDGLHGNACVCDWSVYKCREYKKNKMDRKTERIERTRKFQQKRKEKWFEQKNTSSKLFL